MTEPRKYSPAIQAQLRELANQDIYNKRGPRPQSQHNLIGSRFGRLEVIRPVGHNRFRKLLVLTHCDCGDAKIIGLEALHNGVKSCGCLEAERVGGKHGGQIHRLLKRMIRDGKIGGAFKPAQADTEPARDHSDEPAENQHEPAKENDDD